MNSVLVICQCRLRLCPPRSKNKGEDLTSQTNALSRQMRVAARRQETDNIVTFDLADPLGRELTPFSAGAHIDIEAAPGLVRQYSLLNDPAERNRYQIGVLREPASRGGSQAMHRLQVGDVVYIAGPRNNFSLHPGAHHSWLLAGGIGVTPLLCMARQLHREKHGFTLDYCIRSSAQAAYVDKLQSSPFAFAVHIHYDDGGDEQRLHIDERLAEMPPGTHLYICGPAGFMAWCVDAAARAGVPDAQVHLEYFKAAEPTGTETEKAFDIKLASSGAVFTVATDANILSVLRDNGISLPASCESGVCGTCLTTVLAGTPDHRDVYLSKQERERGDVILPCCSRAFSPLLVLDI
jgi:vanillate O-demethylase ferredoxin subunit